MDSDLSHEALKRFEAIEKRLDALEDGETSLTEVVVLEEEE
jgi:hypothetical protein